AGSGRATVVGPSGPQTAILAEPRAGAEGKRSARAALAASLSLWMWGGGQLLNGDHDLARLLILWQGQIPGLHYLAWCTWDDLGRPETPRESLLHQRMGAAARLRGPGFLVHFPVAVQHLPGVPERRAQERPIHGAAPLVVVGRRLTPGSGVGAAPERSAMEG